MRLPTFDDFSSALSGVNPHEFVEEWWVRLEREIRAISTSIGYEYRNSVVEMITAIGVHPSIGREMIDELYRLRRERNAVVHDIDAPAVSADEAKNYARRAMAVAWYLSELN